jgi:hypothetical protein
MRLLLRENWKCGLRVYITNLITGWSHCDTNRRHTLFDARLLFDAPRHPVYRLHTRARQDLAVAL